MYRRGSAVPIYATPAELWAFMGKAGDITPEFIEQTTPLLRRASALVTRAVRGAVYRADASGIAVDATLAGAMTDAACEQAMSWQLAGVDPYVSATQPKQVVASKSLGSASVSYEANGEAQRRANALMSGDELTGAALRILDEARLLSTEVQAPSYSQRRKIAALDYVVVTGTQVS